MSIRRLTFATMFSLLSIFTVGLVSAGAAGAYATPEGPPVYSTAPGLPDGRVYEQVSPADKNGNEAGATAQYGALGLPGEERYSVASGEGDSVLFEGTGPMGETPTANLLFFVATRTNSGWKTRSLQPRAKQSAEILTTGGAFAEFILMSSEFSQAAIASTDELALEEPTVNGGQLYLTGPDPFVAATWLSRPEIENPLGVAASPAGEYSVQTSGTPVGGSPDLSTVYFTYAGTLLPEDAPRAPHVHINQGSGVAGAEAFGFYEYREGALHEAGVLPDGHLDPFGAVPAASWHGGSLIGNEVSRDGSRAFFVSPDPASCEQQDGENNCAIDPPELYVRENGTKTVLVSQDTLLPDVNGLPVGAPDGLSSVPNRTKKRFSEHMYVFASPDGSQAFFQSEDQLTADAPAGPPSNTSVKTYDFDVETGSLTYLPGVMGQVVATDGDGSAMAFVRPGSGGQPVAELDLWSAGPDGGSVTGITQLPAGEDVEPVRMASDGSKVVFTTSGLPGFNDDAAEIFRYDAATNTLGCVSCAPAGIASSATLMTQTRNGAGAGGSSTMRGMVDDRGMSADGDRVFFQTAAPLVPQVTNTNSPPIWGPNHEHQIPQGQNVYEWENGVVYLISTGRSSLNSYFLDNSENGNDLFFATAEGLVPGDVDGAYDVYDARVPRPGDNPPPAAVPCEGAVCQGPPSVQPPLAAPSSATFFGLGNIPPEPAVSAAAKPKAKAKSPVCKKGYVKEKAKCVRQRKAKKSAKGRK